MDKRTRSWFAAHRSRSNYLRTMTRNSCRTHAERREVGNERKPVTLRDVRISIIDIIAAGKIFRLHPHANIILRAGEFCFCKLDWAIARIATSKQANFSRIFFFLSNNSLKTFLLSSLGYTDYVLLNIFLSFFLFFNVRNNKGYTTII